MTPAFPSCPDHRDWKTLYRAAILETNKNAIPQKVSKAEEAVLARGRELFYNGGTGEEKESLEDALYALRAFKTAWEHTEAAPVGKNKPSHSRGRGIFHSAQSDPDITAIRTE